MSHIRILVVDDSPFWRNLISSILEPETGFEIICQASDGPHAVDMAAAFRPTVVLLDIGLPGFNGMEAARQIHILVPEARIIFVSQEDDPAIIAAVIESGAAGYVLKCDAGRELVKAIHSALRGETLLSCGVLPRIWSNDPSYRYANKH